MRVISTLLAVVMAAAAFSQESLTTERKYVAGEKDTYTMKMSIEGGPGDFSMFMKIIQSITKVYDNGDADLEVEIPEFKMSMGGNDMPSQQIPTQKSKVNKYGKSLDEREAGNPMMNMQFLQYSSYFGEKPLKVGELIDFSEVDKKNPKNKVKGKMKVEEIKDGVAKILSLLDVYIPEAEQPLKLSVTSLVDVKTGKLNKSEGRVTDLPTQGGMTIEAMVYTLERVK